MELNLGLEEPYIARDMSEGGSFFTFYILNGGINNSRINCVNRTLEVDHPVYQ
jgi:hypothetical protein